MEKFNRHRRKKVKKVRKRKPKTELMPFSGLRREMDMTAEEFARFFKILRRIIKEINDAVEESLDKSYGKENKEKTKELKYRKAEGKKDEDVIYEWEDQ